MSRYTLPIRQLIVFSMVLLLAMSCQLPTLQSDEEAQTEETKQDEVKVDTGVMTLRIPKDGFRSLVDVEWEKVNNEKEGLSELLAENDVDLTMDDGVILVDSIHFLFGTQSSKILLEKDLEFRIRKVRFPVDTYLPEAPIDAGFDESDFGYFLTAANLKKQEDDQSADMDNGPIVESDDQSSDTNVAGNDEDNSASGVTAGEEPSEEELSKLKKVRILCVLADDSGVIGVPFLTVAYLKGTNVYFSLTPSQVRQGVWDPNTRLIVSVLVIPPGSNVYVDDNEIDNLTGNSDGKENHEPTVDNVENATVSEGERLDIFLVADDLDSDRLNYMLTRDKPEFVSIKNDNIIVRPGYSEVTDEEGEKDFPISVVIQDNGIPPKSIKLSFTLKVKNATNHPPTVDPIAATTVDEGTRLDLLIPAEDDDEDNLTYELRSEVPDFMHLKKNVLIVEPGFDVVESGTPDQNTYSVTVVVKDDSFEPKETEVIFDIVVNNVNQVPEFDEDLDFDWSCEEGNKLPYVQIQANDPDGDQISYSLGEVVYTTIKYDPETDQPVLDESGDAVKVPIANIDPFNGEFSFYCDYDIVRGNQRNQEVTIEIFADDNTDKTSIKKVINVRNQNRPPRPEILIAEDNTILKEDWANDKKFSIGEGQTIELGINFNDLDGDFVRIKDFRTEGPLGCIDTNSYRINSSSVPSEASYDWPTELYSSYTNAGQPVLSFDPTSRLFRFYAPYCLVNDDNQSIKNEVIFIFTGDDDFGGKTELRVPVAISNTLLPPFVRKNAPTSMQLNEGNYSEPNVPYNCTSGNCGLDLNLRKITGVVNEGLLGINYAKVQNSFCELDNSLNDGVTQVCKTTTTEEQQGLVAVNAAINLVNCNPGNQNTSCNQGDGQYLRWHIPSSLVTALQGMRNFKLSMKATTTIKNPFGASTPTDKETVFDLFFSVYHENIKPTFLIDGNNLAFLDATTNEIADVASFNGQEGSQEEGQCLTNLNSGNQVIVRASDADEETITYSLKNAPAGMTIDPTSGLIAWCPGFDTIKKTDQEYPGSRGYQFAILASDGEDFAQADVNLNLENSDRPPVLTLVSQEVISSDASWDVSEGQTVKIKMIATDPDGAIVTNYGYQFLTPSNIANTFNELTKTWTISPDFGAIPATENSGEYLLRFSVNSEDMETSIIKALNVGNIVQSPSVRNQTFMEENILVKEFGREGEAGEFYPCDLGFYDMTDRFNRDYVVNRCVHIACDQQGAWCDGNMALIFASRNNQPLNGAVIRLQDLFRRTDPDSQINMDYTVSQVVDASTGLPVTIDYGIYQVGGNPEEKVLAINLPYNLVSKAQNTRTLKFKFDAFYRNTANSILTDGHLTTAVVNVIVQHANQQPKFVGTNLPGLRINPLDPNNPFYDQITIDEKTCYSYDFNAVDGDGDTVSYSTVPAAGTDISADLTAQGYAITIDQNGNFRFCTDNSFVNKDNSERYFNISMQISDSTDAAAKLVRHDMNFNVKNKNQAPLLSLNVQTGTDSNGNPTYGSVPSLINLDEGSTYNIAAQFSDPDENGLWKSWRVRICNAYNPLTGLSQCDGEIHDSNAIFDGKDYFCDWILSDPGSQSPLKPLYGANCRINGGEWPYFANFNYDNGGFSFTATSELVNRIEGAKYFGIQFMGEDDVWYDLPHKTVAKEAIIKVSNVNQQPLLTKPDFIDPITEGQNGTIWYNLEEFDNEKVKVTIAAIEVDSGVDDSAGDVFQALNYGATRNAEILSRFALTFDFESGTGVCDTTVRNGWCSGARIIANDLPYYMVGQSEATKKFRVKLDYVDWDTVTGTAIGLTKSTSIVFTVIHQNQSPQLNLAVKGNKSCRIDTAGIFSCTTITDPYIWTSNENPVSLLKFETSGSYSGRVIPFEEGEGLVDANDNPTTPFPINYADYVVDPDVTGNANDDSLTLSTEWTWFPTGVYADNFSDTATCKQGDKYVGCQMKFALRNDLVLSSDTEAKDCKIITVQGKKYFATSSDTNTSTVKCKRFFFSVKTRDSKYWENWHTFSITVLNKNGKPIVRNDARLAYGVEEFRSNLFAITDTPAPKSFDYVLGETIDLYQIFQDFDPQDSEYIGGLTFSVDTGASYCLNNDGTQGSALVPGEFSSDGELGLRWTKDQFNKNRYFSFKPSFALAACKDPSKNTVDDCALAGKVWGQIDNNGIRTCKLKFKASDTSNATNSQLLTFHVKNRPQDLPPYLATYKLDNVKVVEEKTSRISLDRLFTDPEGTKLMFAWSENGQPWGKATTDFWYGDGCSMPAYATQTECAAAGAIWFTNGTFVEVSPYNFVSDQGCNPLSLVHSCGEVLLGLKISDGQNEITETIHLPVKDQNRPVTFAYNFNDMQNQRVREGNSWPWNLVPPPPPATCQDLVLNDYFSDLDSDRLFFKIDQKPAGMTFNDTQADNLTRMSWCNIPFTTVLTGQNEKEFYVLGTVNDKKDNHSDLPFYIKLIVEDDPSQVNPPVYNGNTALCSITIKEDEPDPARRQFDLKFCTSYDNLGALTYFYKEPKAGQLNKSGSWSTINGSTFDYYPTKGVSSANYNEQFTAEFIARDNSKYPPLETPYDKAIKVKITVANLNTPPMSAGAPQFEVKPGPVTVNFFESNLFFDPDFEDQGNLTLTIVNDGLCGLIGGSTLNRLDHGVWQYTCPNNSQPDNSLRFVEIKANDAGIPVIYANSGLNLHTTTGNLAPQSNPMAEPREFFVDINPDVAPVGSTFTIIPYIDDYFYDQEGNTIRGFSVDVTWDASDPKTSPFSGNIAFNSNAITFTTDASSDGGQYRLLVTVTDDGVPPRLGYRSDLVLILVDSSQSSPYQKIARFKPAILHEGAASKSFTAYAEPVSPATLRQFNDFEYPLLNYFDPLDWTDSRYCDATADECGFMVEARYGSFGENYELHHWLDPDGSGMPEGKPIIKIDQLLASSGSLVLNETFEQYSFLGKRIMVVKRVPSYVSALREPMSKRDMIVVGTRGGMSTVVGGVSKELFSRGDLNVTAITFTRESGLLIYSSYDPLSDTSSIYFKDTDLGVGEFLFNTNGRVMALEMTMDSELLMSIRQKTSPTPTYQGRIKVISTMGFERIDVTSDAVAHEFLMDEQGRYLTTLKNPVTNAGTFGYYQILQGNSIAFTPVPLVFEADQTKEVVLRLNQNESGKLSFDINGNLILLPFGFYNNPLNPSGNISTPVAQMVVCTLTNDSCLVKEHRALPQFGYCTPAASGISETDCVANAGAWTSQPIQGIALAYAPGSSSYTPTGDGFKLYIDGGNEIRTLGYAQAPYFVQPYPYLWDNGYNGMLGEQIAIDFQADDKDGYVVSLSTDHCRDVSGDNVSNCQALGNIVDPTVLDKATFLTQGNFGTLNFTPDFSGSYVFKMRATDNAGHVSVRLFTITVGGAGSGTNLPPKFPVPSAIRVSQYGHYEIFNVVNSFFVTDDTEPLRAVTGWFSNNCVKVNIWDDWGHPDAVGTPIQKMSIDSFGDCSPLTFTLEVEDSGSPARRSSRDVTINVSGYNQNSNDLSALTLSRRFRSKHVQYFAGLNERAEFELELVNFGADAAVNNYTVKLLDRNGNQVGSFYDQVSTGSSAMGELLAVETDLFDTTKPIGMNLSTRMLWLDFDDAASTIPRGAADDGYRYMTLTVNYTTVNGSGTLTETKVLGSAFILEPMSGTRIAAVPKIPQLTSLVVGSEQEVHADQFAAKTGIVPIEGPVYLDFQPYTDPVYCLTVYEDYDGSPVVDTTSWRGGCTPITATGTYATINLCASYNQDMIPKTCADLPIYIVVPSAGGVDSTGHPLQVTKMYRSADNRLQTDDTQNLFYLWEVEVLNHDTSVDYFIDGIVVRSFADVAGTLTEVIDEVRVRQQVNLTQSAVGNSLIGSHIWQAYGYPNYYQIPIGFNAMGQLDAGRYLGISLVYCAYSNTTTDPSDNSTHCSTSTSTAVTYPLGNYAVLTEAKYTELSAPPQYYHKLAIRLGETLDIDSGDYYNIQDIWSFDPLNQEFGIEPIWLSSQQYTADRSWACLTGHNLWDNVNYTQGDFVLEATDDPSCVGAKIETDLVFCPNDSYGTCAWGGPRIYIPLMVEVVDITADAPLLLVERIDYLFDKNKAASYTGYPWADISPILDASADYELFAVELRNIGNVPAKITGVSLHLLDPDSGVEATGDLTEVRFNCPDNAEVFYEYNLPANYCLLDGYVNDGPQPNPDGLAMPTNWYDMVPPCFGDQCPVGYFEIDFADYGYTEPSRLRLLDLTIYYVDAACQDSDPTNDPANCLPIATPLTRIPGTVLLEKAPF